MENGMIILEEDLIVEEAWLKRIGAIESSSEDEEDAYINRKAVFDILRESVGELKDNMDYIEMAFKIAMLPIIRKPKIETAIIYADNKPIAEYCRAG